MRGLLVSAGLLLVSLAPSVNAQCDAGNTNYYVSAYSFRSLGTVISSTQAYATGPNAGTSTVYVRQSDFITPTPLPTHAIGSPITAVAPPGSTASNNRYTPVATTGYGTYSTSGYMYAYRACDGRSFPPYDNGFSGYSNPANLVVTQPQARTDAYTLYPQSYLSYNPNGTVPTYPNIAHLTAVANGAVGTPVWTFQSSPKISYSCTSCVSPVATVSPTTVAGDCFASLTGSFTLDGLNSTSVFLTILVPLTSPLDSGTSIDVPGGYQTSVKWIVEDSCGDTWPYLHMAENFPNGFTAVYPNNNWAVPIANSWDAVGDATWVDIIGFSDTTGSAIPTALPPQSPLQNTLVFYGTQDITAGTTPIATQSQAHYQDHGGYR